MDGYQKILEAPAKLVVLAHSSGKLVVMVISPSYPKNRPEITLQIDHMRRVVFKRGVIEG